MIFEYLVNKYSPFKPDEIEADVEKLNQILHGFEPFDKAYAKWTEDYEDD